MFSKKYRHFCCYAYLNFGAGIKCSMLVTLRSLTVLIEIVINNNTYYLISIAQINIKIRSNAHK